MQMYLNTNTNTFKSISNTNTNTFMFLYHFSDENFVLFVGIKNVTITDPLYLGTCVWWVMFVPRLGLKSNYFVHVNESTVLTGLHLSRISNPQITCKVNTCEMIYFCSGSSHLYMDLHRWYWPIRCCLERDSVCTWSIVIRIHKLYHTCGIPLFKQHRPQLLLDHNHTMGYWVFVSFIFIECFTTTFLRAHSWLNWVDEDDDEDEVGLKEKPEDTRYIKKITSK